MTTLDAVSFFVGVFITLCSFAGTALQYKALPKEVNMNPSLGSMGMLLPRPWIFVLPVVQTGVLFLIYYSAGSGTVSPSQTHANNLRTVVMPQALMLSLFFVQMWFIRRTREDADS